MLMLLITTAIAAEPVVLESMLDYDGQDVLDPTLLGQSYRQLVMEMATGITGPWSLPARTTGRDGFSVELQTLMVFQEGRFRDGPSPWERAHPDQDPVPYSFSPGIAVRKGLPLSTEVGGAIGWLAGSGSGRASVFGRVSVLEGWQPLPDLNLHMDLNTLVGHQDFNLTTFRLGVTLGANAPIGSWSSMRSGRLQPFVDFSTIRATSRPTVSDQLAAQIGATGFVGVGDETTESAILMPAVSGGFQVQSLGAHIKVAGSWVPQTIPTATVALGFSL